MRGDVEVQDPAAPVLDDEKTVEQPECQCRHGEEVEGDDHLAVILEKRKPPLAGSPRRRIRRRYLATVRSETSKPSLSSSPWSFGAPHPEFSAAIVRMCVQSSLLILGRPPFGWDRQPQYKRNPVRCQPTTVSGLTTARTSDHRGQSWRKVVQKKRSKRVSGGRGRFRFGDGDLLAQREDFDGGIRAPAEENARCS